MNAHVIGTGIGHHSAAYERADLAIIRENWEQRTKRYIPGTHTLDGKMPRRERMRFPTVRELAR